MANTITLYDTIPGRALGLGPIYVYQCVFDATTGLETIRTPATGNRIFAVGLQLSDDSAGTINFGSANTTILPYIIAVNQGVHDKALNGFFFNTKASEAFTIGTTMALTLMVRVVEGIGIETYDC